MDKNTGFLVRVVVLGSVGLSGCAPSSDAPPSRPITVTLLHTNDTHSHLEPFPHDGELSAGNQGPQQGGIARRKTLIDAVRAREPHVLLLDAGDSFQSTIFYNAWKGSAEIMALNALGYDAATLGNHEFDLGPAELGRALRGEPVKIAGASYPTEKPRLPIVVTHPTISSPGPHVRFLDAVTSVQAEVDRLRAAGIDKIILLSHAGYSVDRVRAPRWRGIDIIVSGHDHALLGDPAAVEAVAPGQYPTVATAADGAPVLVVSGYEWGRWLGRLTVSFDEHGVVQQWAGQPIFVRGCAFVRGAVDCSAQSAPEDPVVKARIAAYRAPMDRFARALIGRAGRSFDGGRTPGLRTQEMPLGNLIADTVLSSASRSDLGNTLAVLDLKGEQLVAALDYGVSRPGEGAFPQVAGLKLHYCVATPCPAALRSGGRVTALTVNGVPVDRAATYRIAVNNFMIGGGDGTGEPGR